MRKFIYFRIRDIPRRHTNSFAEDNLKFRVTKLWADSICV
ncbi:MAG: hypothetical protein QOH70_1676 [Blastocatellia bacterium]|jgi:hypothetical protein|nr:hypothetical protein [Blastocatellia bacterium]